MEVKDVYNSIQRYKKTKKNLAKNTSIKPTNKKLFLEWINKKEDELKRRKGRDTADQIRYSKTLYKYITMLKAVDSFFNKPLTKVTEKDMRQVYDDLEEGRIKNAKGKKLAKSTRRDFYNKIFKSDFFGFIGKKDIAKKIFILERSDDEEVKFFEKEDLDLMAKFTTKTRNKLLLYLLFDTGIRIGTVLNLRAKDFDKRHNIQTKQDYYLVHIRKDYTKSKTNRTIALLLNETNELLDVVLKGIDKNKLLFDFSYSNAVKLVKRVSKKAKVKTKPDKKEISIHDFRRSCATYLLSQGFSVDFVKKRLGHKPSSTVIDKYINYLGLKEEKAVTQAQDLDYNKLRVAYKEAIERIKALDQNQKQISEEFKLYKKEIKQLVKRTISDRIDAR